MLHPTRSLSRSFDRMCSWLAREIGKPRTFLACLLVAVAWLALLVFVPSWRETINNAIGAGTGVLGVLLLVINQNGQNREGAASQAKMDEMIRVTDAARNELIAVEEQAVEDIAALRAEGKP